MERLTFLNGDDVPCVKGVNSEDRPESGQMPGRCGEGGAESSSGPAARAFLRG